jgi:general secretion pathway protein J
MRAGRHTPTGFTLIEVMVALLIMSLMTVMAWSGINGLLKSREVAQAHLDHSARLQTVMAQWDSDLRAVQDSGSVPAIAFDGASLRLTRQQPQGLQVVVWSLREGRLLRWEGPPQQSANELGQTYERSLRLQIQDRGQLSTLEGISAWQLYFYRGNGWSNAQSSDDVSNGSDNSPPPPGPGASGPGKGADGQGQGQGQGSGDKDGSGPRRAILPSGVRLVLQFAPDSGFNGSLTRQIILGPQS